MLGGAALALKHGSTKLAALPLATNLFTSVTSVFSIIASGQCNTPRLLPQRGVTRWCVPHKQIRGLDKFRSDKQKKHDAMLSNIKRRAAQERAAYKKLAQDEPDALASGGDMPNTSKPCDDEDG